MCCKPLWHSTAQYDEAIRPQRLRCYWYLTGPALMWTRSRRVWSGRPDLFNESDRIGLEAVVQMPGLRCIDASLVSTIPLKKEIIPFVI